LNIGKRERNLKFKEAQISMSILITGGAGFIGSHLAEHLLKRGEKVIVVDNLNDEYAVRFKKRNLQEISRHGRFVFYETDIATRSQLEKILKENAVRCICHLAGSHGIRRSINDPLHCYWSNVLMGTTLIESAAACDVPKLIFASSSAVYGRGEAPFAEADNTDHPNSPFAASKKSIELAMHSAYHTHGLACAGLRFFTVYGERNRPDSTATQLAGAIENGYPIELYGRGNILQDWVYIDDVIDGIARTIDKEFGYEIFNLGSGGPVSMIDIIGCFEHELGRLARRKLLDDEDRRAPDSCWADISQAKDKLGYHPKISVRQGIKKFIGWYKKNR